MKMFYGNIPVNSMKIKHYEMNTNDSNLKPSDMQAGIIAYGKGKRIVGTGKAFEFANYGTTTTNTQNFVSVLINVVEIASTEYPIKSVSHLLDMQNIDFTTEQTIAFVIIDDVEYPITVRVDGDILTFNCEKAIVLDFFYGKDNYICMIEPRLAYWYAVIDGNNCCVGVQTTTCEVPLDTYIQIPVLTNDYMGKYYDRETDIWYYDQEHTRIFNPEA